jgi:spore coat protein CotF
MIFHMTMMNAAGISNYAVSLASSPRPDLALMYGKQIVQTADFANDGLKIMIDNGWMEEPPRYIHRSELVNTVKH